MTALVTKLSALALALSLTCNAASAGGLKTLRVEHGQPTIAVSHKGVLLLEFTRETATETVSEPVPGTRTCRASYRLKWFDAASGSVTNSQGSVHEGYRVVSANATGRMVESIGSQTGIGAGDFVISWSEANAGTRSWLYYRADSPLRFIQQPQHLTFSDVDEAQFRKFFASRNVEEFISAGRTVHVIGPAIFVGDLPTETAVSGRIDSVRVKDGAAELKLSQLATNTSYVIEASYDLKAGDWKVVHMFSVREPDHTWSDPLAPEIRTAFYRIRQGH